MRIEEGDGLCIGGHVQLASVESGLQSLSESRAAPQAPQAPQADLAAAAPSTKER